jgi:ParB-like chromosome segregation protein Spo0J
LKQMVDISEHEVVLVKVADIKTDGDNPNSMDDATKARLLASMTTWGNTQPVIVDKNTMLLADGEHRLRQYVAAGKTEIPAMLVAFDSDADRRSYRQAANKIRGSHIPERDSLEFQRIIEAGRGDLLELATGMRLSQVEKHLRRTLSPVEDVSLVERPCNLCKGTGRVFFKKRGVVGDAMRSADQDQNEMQ